MRYLILSKDFSCFVSEWNKARYIVPSYLPIYPSNLPEIIR